MATSIRHVAACRITSIERYGARSPISSRSQAAVSAGFTPQFVGLATAGRRADLSLRVNAASEAPSANTMELHYFPLRGLGEMVRMALSASVGSEGWTEMNVDRAAMKTDLDTYHFFQAPSFQDGDVKICQSNAIMRYIARKNDMYGSSDLEKAQIDEVMDGIVGLRSKYLELIYAHEFADDEKAAHWEAHGVPAAAPTSRGAHLTFLSALLKKNSPDGKGFVVGSKISIADCILMDVLELYTRAFPTQMADTYPEFTAFLAFMYEQKGIKEYLASGKRPSQINGNKHG